MIRRSGDTMCDPHHTHGGDEKRGLPSLASKSVTTICEWFGLKTTTTVSLCHIPKFSFRNVNHFFSTRNLKFPKEFIYFNPK
jgi:hypothetical protein